MNLEFAFWKSQLKRNRFLVRLRAKDLSYKCEHVALVEMTQACLQAAEDFSIACKQASSLDTVDSKFRKDSPVAKFSRPKTD